MLHRGGKISLTEHFKPLWARNVPKFGIVHAMGLGVTVVSDSCLCVFDCLFLEGLHVFFFLEPPKIPTLLPGPPILDVNIVMIAWYFSHVCTINSREGRREDLIIEQT